MHHLDSGRIIPCKGRRYVTILSDTMESIRIEITDGIQITTYTEMYMNVRAKTSFCCRPVCEVSVHLDARFSWFLTKRNNDSIEKIMIKKVNEAHPLTKRNVYSVRLSGLMFKVSPQYSSNKGPSLSELQGLGDDAIQQNPILPTLMTLKATAMLAEIRGKLMPTEKKKTCTRCILFSCQPYLTIRRVWIVKNAVKKAEPKNPTIRSAP